MDIVMDTSLTTEEASRKVKERTGFELYDWQVEAVQHVLAGKDVLITAAATAGKTTASLAAAMLMEKGDAGLVVCPSDEPGHSALVEKAKALGLRTVSYSLDVTSPAWLGDGKHEIQERSFFDKVKMFDYDLIFVPAEFIVSNQTLQRLSLEGGRIPFCRRVRFIAIEDAHLASFSKFDMGRSRPAWQGLHKLRQYFREEFSHGCCPSPILASSSTMRPHSKYVIQHALRLGTDYHYISRPLDRPNIHIAMFQMEGAVHERRDLDFLMIKMVGQPARTREEVPRAVIFEDNNVEARKSSDHIEALGAKHGIEREPDPEDALLGIPFAAPFHSLLSDSAKAYILRHWKAGRIRVIVATESIGLDLDADVDQIHRSVSFGSFQRDGHPLTIDALTQRIFGFAARDGKTQGVAIVVTHPWMHNQPSLSTSEVAHLINGKGETVTMPTDLLAMLNNQKQLLSPEPPSGPPAPTDPNYRSTSALHPDDADVVYKGLRRMRARCFHEKVRSADPETTQEPPDIMPESRLIAAANRYHPSMPLSQFRLHLEPCEHVDAYDLDTLKKEVDHLILRQQAARDNPESEEQWEDEEPEGRAGSPSVSDLSVD